MIKFKGIDLFTKGIIVEKTPTISKGKKKINIYEIDGRNGFLSIDTGVYAPFSITLECHCKDTANKEDIKQFLDGYGTLSFDDEKQYTAIVNDAIPFEKVMNFKRFQINFLVNPIAEDIIATSSTISSSPTTLTINDTYSEIYPILKIAGSGDIEITINNKTFYLNDIDGEYILDCKNKVITKNNINASSSMYGDFPTLINGENTISYTGTISSFEIEYRKTYL